MTSNKALTTTPNTIVAVPARQLRNRESSPEPVLRERDAGGTSVHQRRAAREGPGCHCDPGIGAATAVGGVATTVEGDRRHDHDDARKAAASLAHRSIHLNGRMGKVYHPSYVDGGRLAASGVSH